MLPNIFKVAISSDFLLAFAALQKAQQKKVSSFIKKFRENPAGNGINYEKLVGTYDKNFRSVRIDQAYRAIVLRPAEGNVYVLLWVDKEQNAYRWAANKNCTVNHTTGSLQLFDVPTASALPLKSTNTPKLFANLSDNSDILLQLGVPEPYLARVLGLETEEDLDAISPELPEEASNALYKLACGYPLDQVIAEVKKSAGLAARPTDFAAALESPASLTRFHLIEDEPALEPMLTMTLADRVREFVYRKYLSPARRAGRAEIEIRAGDVHRMMGLSRRLPAVCSALTPKKFAAQYRLQIIDRRGPKEGANVFFRFKL